MTLLQATCAGLRAEVVAISRLELYETNRRQLLPRCQGRRFTAPFLQRPIFTWLFFCIFFVYPRALAAPHFLLDTLRKAKVLQFIKLFFTRIER